MKSIVLKRLSLVNFKGMAHLEIDFGDTETTISGRNGSGKTTVFDAFTWLLFGKDSRDRKSFDIKTLDAEGNVIPRLPHEVSAELMVGAEKVTLMRRYSEKWVKRRGSAVEEFTGHEEERYYNDVPCNTKEWAEKIAAICPENVFKFITSPFCFTAQKPEAQRTMLFSMAGGFSDNEVIAASGQRQDFITLLGKLCGKSMDDYKKEISAKKRKLKAEIDALPERIDERRRDNLTYAQTDYTQCEAELKQKTRALAEIEKQLESVSEQVNAAYRLKHEAASKLTAKKDELLKAESDIRGRMSEDYYKSEEQIRSLKSQIAAARLNLAEDGRNLAACGAKKDELKRINSEIRSQLAQISKSTLTFANGDFICPTCHQQLDAENIDKKQSEMLLAFNAQKSQKTKALYERGRKECSKEMFAELDSRIAKLEASTESATAEIKELEEKLAATPQPVKPTEEEIAAQIRQSELCAGIAKEIEKLTQELDSTPTADTSATQELKDAREMITTSIAELKAALETRKFAERNNERIAELEQHLKSQSQALAELENIEFTITEFVKAKIEAVEGKINALFSLVRFKMYETQINGGEVETCEATVGGVPYSSLNSAMRINAGLDIINTICKYQGIAAPIFIDNCESVLQPLKTIGQQVRLVVVDKDLTIE